MVHEQDRDPRRTTEANKDRAPRNPLEIDRTRCEDWFDDKDALTIHERPLLEARLAAYAKDPNTGSTWEEVEGRIRARLSRQPNG